MGAFVYLLQCADRSYYVGSATGNDLWRRIAEHETGAYRGYTCARRPVRLVWSEHFESDHGRYCNRKKDQSLEPGEEGSASQK
jgi:predicted GIY-YIG superfamily endonuclease